MGVDREVCGNGEEEKSCWRGMQIGRESRGRKQEFKKEWRGKRMNEVG